MVAGRFCRGCEQDPDSSCAILTNRAFKCWGSNLWGQLGLGDTLDRGANAADMGDALPPVDLGSSSDMKPELTMDESLRQRALSPIERMLTLS